MKAWAKQLKAASWAKLSTDADDYRQTSFDNLEGQVEQLLHHMDRQVRRDNVNVTISSGGRSATIGGQPQ